MDFWRIMPLIGAALTFIGGLAGAHIGAYLKTKAENRAEREDIKWLKEKVAMVTETTKRIETDMSDAAWNRQRRWELKREVLFEAAKKLAQASEAMVEFDGIAQKQLSASVTDEYPRETIDKLQRAINGLAETIIFVDIVCEQETTAAVERVLGAVVKIVDGLAAKDASMNKGYMLRKSLFDAKEAIRKELGFGGYF